MLKRTIPSSTRSLSTQEVYGRLAGGIDIENHTYGDVSVVYDGTLYTPDGLSDDDAMRWLREVLSVEGRHELWDERDPSWYRIGTCKGSSDLKLIRPGRIDVSITFTCDALMYSTDGDNPLVYTASGTIENTTRRTAYPLITLTATADVTVTIGGRVLTIAGFTGALIIDSEIEHVQSAAGVNLCGKASGAFPTILVGQQAISFTGCSSITIKPRWTSL